MVFPVSRFSIMCFIQRPFVIMLMRGKKKYDSWLEKWSLHFPMSLLVSSEAFSFPGPKEVHIRWSGVLTCSSLSECECVIVPCDEMFLPGWVPPSTLSWDGLQLLQPWISRKSLSYLLLLLFLKCMYNSHLFQCLILGVFWVFS